MLSAEQLEYRRGKVTATDARMIMNARTDDELLRWFKIKVGIEPPEPDSYAKSAGLAMEPVILHAFELSSGEAVTRRQEVVDHPGIKDFMATIDGWQASSRRVVEAKFCSPFMSKDELFLQFFPQVSFQMMCTEATEGVLLLAQGTSPPVEIECIRDAAYESELIDRCKAWLLCIQTLAPPCALPIVIPPEKWRTIDVIKEPTNWSSELLAALVEYDETAKAAEAHEHWGTVARELVPDDVGKVIAGTFTLSRNKRGVISIRRAAA